MHLIYRSKKQTLPIVSQNKVSWLPSSSSQKNPSSEMLRKKSIDLVFDKHLYPMNATEAAMIYNPPQRKTFYRKARSKKAESGYIKGNSFYDQPVLVVRNKSTQITQRQPVGRRKGQISPYVLGQKKSRSSTKFKNQRDQDEKQGRDWICQHLIQKEVYSIQEGSDFI